jgi:peptide/nickel transport system substrate-binding protein
MKNKNLKIFSNIFIITIILTEFSGCIDTKINNKDDIYEFKVAFGIDIFNGFYPWMGFINQQTISINSNIFNGLVEFDEGYQILPALAESWNNPNNLTWRFNLRKDVKFHNGNNFSADDVKYSIELIKGDKNNTLNIFLSMVKEVIIVDDFTVDIVTLEPYPLLTNKLVYIFMVSKQNHGELSNSNPIGTGAYRFSNYLKDNYIVLERFEGYWRKKPEFQKVTFKFFDSYEDQLNNFLEGNADIIDIIDPNDYDNLSKKPGLKLLPFTFNTIAYLGFNFIKNNPFFDVRVRKAIYHAIDIDEIIENALDGYAEPASQYVSNYIFGYNPEINRLPYDLEKARQYMKDAGYENGFEIILDCRESELRENASRIIADQLSLLNITLDVNILSRNDFYSKISNRDSLFYFVGWAVDSGDAGEIFDNVLRTVDIEKSFGISNFGNYSNPLIDEIAEDIFYNMNSVERLYLMKDGFSIAMEDVVCIPLYILKSFSVIKDEFSLSIRADGLIKIEDIKIDRSINTI